MVNHFYSIGYESQAQGHDRSDLRNTPPASGYYELTPPSEYGLSPSPDRCPQDGPELLFSTEPDTSKLLQISEWEANRQNDELPASFTLYTIQLPWRFNVLVCAIRPRWYYGFGILQSRDCFLSKMILGIGA